MTKMLDIFEQFLNLHGYIYVRLDGSVKTENRQKLVDRFNFNKKIFCFISSTRCGGVGINLTGADCVVFYDTDWNPAMDKQAQDRCHRIGQTKTVHIYRLISVNTIEENIFKKSLQKRELGGLIIEGNFNKEFFQKVSVKDMLTMDNDANVFTKPKRIDIFKDENIVFDDQLGEDFILRDKLNIKKNNQEELDEDQIDFETNSQDLEIQAKEFERQQQIEMYRRRFEEALIRIEDQEDVEAMYGANKEMRDNDDEDVHEFDEVADEMEIEGENIQEGLTEEQKTQIRKQKSQDQLENQKLQEFYAKQKINDGISLTQGEMKKHHEIDWNENPNLNKVTRQCLNFVKENYTFEEYLEERAKKDSKFVSLQLDDKIDDYVESEKNSLESENDVSEEYDEEIDENEQTNQNLTDQQKQQQKRQERRTAEQFMYNTTKAQLENLLHQKQADNDYLQSADEIYK